MDNRESLDTVSLFVVLHALKSSYAALVSMSLDADFMVAAEALAACIAQLERLINRNTITVTFTEDT